MLQPKLFRGRLANSELGKRRKQLMKKEQMMLRVAAKEESYIKG